MEYLECVRGEVGYESCEHEVFCHLLADLCGMVCKFLVEFMKFVDCFSGIGVRFEFPVKVFECSEVSSEGFIEEFYKVIEGNMGSHVQFKVVLWDGEGMTFLQEVGVSDFVKVLFLYVFKIIEGVSSGEDKVVGSCVREFGNGCFNVFVGVYTVNFLGGKGLGLHILVGFKVVKDKDQWGYFGQCVGDCTEFFGVIWLCGVFFKNVLNMFVVYFEEVRFFLEFADNDIHGVSIGVSEGVG